MASDYSSSDLLERAFNLIQSGNEHESSSQPWQAALSFAQAADLLHRLARETTRRPKEATGADEADAGGAEDDSSRKIAALYANQSLEYTIRSRSILLLALQDEHDRDKKTSGEVSESDGKDGDASLSLQTSFLRSSLSEEELDQRLRLFASLFARPLPAPRSAADAEAAPNADAGDAAAVTEQSLQDRWMRLSQNLPKSFKTSDQRLAEINRGLNRLGLSSVQYHDPSMTASSRINPHDVLGGINSPQKTESEQVEDIIAQAADEVRMLQQQMGPLSSRPLGGATTATIAGGVPAPLGSDSDGDSSDHDSEEEVDEDDDDENEAADDELSPSQIASIGDHAATAMSELAQLLALLERDEGGDAAIEFDPAPGRRHLRSAAAALRRARRAWNNSSAASQPAAGAAAPDGTA